MFHRAALEQPADAVGITWLVFITLQLIQADSLQVMSDAMTHCYATLIVLLILPIELP